MYVRTKKGEIFDCYESEQMHKPIYYPKKSKTNGYIDYEDVYKKSDNLIGILQVGDYVNGHKVADIYEDINGQVRMKFGENGLVLAHKSNYDNYYLFEEDIKSIVTKEKFESMEYRL